MADPMLTGAIITFQTNDDSEMGPFALWVSNSVSREQLKTGHVTIGITPNGYDTWRFNFVLDLIFSDGGHLLARATGIELTQDSGPQSFGIE
jgi:hypothetical protein